MVSLSFKTITDITDSYLCDWLDLYETAFPPEERILISVFIRQLLNQRQEEIPPLNLIAALDSEKRFIGLACYQWQPEMNWFLLWYLAVMSKQRGLGWGSEILQEIERHARSKNCDGILFEVEIPESVTSPEMKILAERRIQFYKRNGAKMFSGIHYLQSVGPHQLLTPMHLMFYPLKESRPEDVFYKAKYLFGDLLTKTGSLALV